MRPGRTGWYSGLGFVVLSLGGGMLLLGSRSSGSMREPVSPVTRYRSATTCAEFWAATGGEYETNTQYDGLGEGALNLRLVRNRHWDQLKLNQYGEGGWIGGIHNPNQNANANSRKFPSLKHQQKVCIWFFTKRDASGNLAHGADLYHEDGSAPEPLTALYCSKGHGSEMKKPFWDVVPPGCDTVHYTSGAISVVIKNPAGGALTAEILRTGPFEINLPAIAFTVTS